MSCISVRGNHDTGELTLWAQAAVCGRCETGDQAVITAAETERARRHCDTEIALSFCTLRLRRLRVIRRLWMMMMMRLMMMRMMNREDVAIWAGVSGMAGDCDQ